MNECDRLIEAYFDGSISDADAAALSAWLKADHENTRRFIALASFQSSLVDQLAFTSDDFKEPVVDESSAKSVSRDATAPTRVLRLPAAWRIAAAVAILATAVAIYFLIISQSEQNISPRSTSPVATIIESTGELIVDDSFTYAGGEYPAGRYELAGGRAEILLTNRVGIELDGPTRMHMRNPMNASLELGSARFRCPPGLKGFTVHLPNGVRVVDLGTVFHISVGVDGLAEVFVDEGEVEVFNPQGRGQRLLAGRSVAISAAGVMADVVETGVNPALAESILLYLPFDRKRGRFNASTASIEFQGDPQRVAGRFGDALRFNGNRDALRTLVPGVEGARDRSVACWVRIDPVADSIKAKMPLIGWGKMSATHAWQVSLLINNAKGSVQVGSDIRGGQDLADGRWHHLAVVVRDKNTQIFIDGALVEEKMAPRLNTLVSDPASRPIVIGQHIDETSNSSFAGEIDELYVFDTALTESQIGVLIQGATRSP
ncbi:LamG domain-containing protein [Planctomycetales bacterium ZRK34]|nr:LamG domain-containing protein [Planctomycetales bacterium ZRK34]